MATSLTFGPAWMQFSAAPRPRPPRGLPQPIRPTRITSLPAMCTLSVAANSEVKAAPITVAVEAFKKSRRLDVLLSLELRSEAMIRFSLEIRANDGDGGMAKVGME